MSNLKLLVVFGATGNQGGSVVNFVLNDKELSAQFKIRGITRDSSKPAAQKLASQGVEMIDCDVANAKSVDSALQGAHTVFIMIAADYNTSTREDELTQGKVITDAAVANGASHLIFSTLPSIITNSSGTLTHAWPFDVKAEIGSYIRSRPVQSSFFSPGSFMQNFHTAYKPRKADDGTYFIPSIEDSDSKHMPLIDIGDTGKYIGAMLSDPDKYQGKTLYAANGLSSWNEIVGIVSKITGKTVRHKVIPESVFRGFMNAVRGNELCDMMNNRAKFGYYGKTTAEGIEWSMQQVKGKLTSLEEYLREHPIELS